MEVIQEADSTALRLLPQRFASLNEVRPDSFVSFVNFCSNVFALPDCLFESGYLVDLYRECDRWDLWVWCLSKIFYLKLGKNPGVDSPARLGDLEWEF